MIQIHLTEMVRMKRKTEDTEFDLQTRFNKELAIKQEECSVMVKAENVQDAEDYISEFYIYNPERLYSHSVDSSSGSQLYLKNEEIDIKSENDEMMSEMNDSLGDGEMVDTVLSGASNDSGKKGNTKTGNNDKSVLSPYKTRMLNQRLSQKTSEETLNHSEKCTKFKCEKCLYKTDRKSNLWSHNLMHMDTSEVVMHKCDNCEYQTRYRSDIIRHMLKMHPDPKAERKFKCEICPYETDVKGDLSKHNKTHVDKSEMHKCDSCKYETRYQKYMIRHMRKHGDPKARRKL